MLRPKKYKWRIIRGVFLSFFIVLFTIISFVGGQSLFSGQPQQIASAGIESAVANTIANTTLQNSYPLRNWDIENLIIQAPAAISVEMGHDTNKILFSKNETIKLPIASLTKLMTALVALENYSLDQKVAISGLAMTQEGTQGNLKAGEILSVNDLLYITLIESSNRSAYALSEVIGAENFITTMNATAERLGLVNTHFTDSTGLSSQSHSTVEDLVKLSNYLFKTYPIFNQIINTKEYDLYLTNGQFHHKLVNTNKLLGVTPEVIGGKTGWTNEAKGCFMVIEKSPKEGNYIINVVLGADDRFLEIKNIIDWTKTAYAWQ